MVINTTLTAKKNRATLKPALILFKGDIVFIEFTLINSLITSINGVEVEESLPLDMLEKVEMKLVTPEGEEKLESIEVVDNRARFKMTASEVVGDYPFQLTCFDKDGCKFKLPASSYTILDDLG